MDTGYIDVMAMAKAVLGAGSESLSTSVNDNTDRVSILVVDDLAEKRLVLETILAELGENLVTAASGEEALRAVLHQDFAVILLDVNMPGMDGLETAAFIRRRKKSAHTPIIFITAYSDELHTAQGYSLGAVDYILSPIVPAVLRTKVKVFVDLFRMTEQVRRQADERIALIQEQAARLAAEEATRRSMFLVDAGATLMSSLDFDATMRNLARVAIPFLADLGAVTQVDDQGHLQQTEVAWSEERGARDEGRGTINSPLIPHPSPLVRSRTYRSCEELPPFVGRTIGQVCAQGERQVIEAERWCPAESDPGSNGSPPLTPPSPPGGEGRVRGSARWFMVVLPLTARGRTLGVLTLGRSGRPYDGADLALTQALASRAATALDNARLYQNIQEGDRRKDEFLAMLAHELRNPLAPLRNAAQIMRLLGGQLPALIQARDMVDRQVTHMTRLIDDLLDTSRLSRGKILLRKVRLDLTQLVGSVVQDYRNILEASKLNFDVRLPNEPLYVQGDPTRLAQVLGNILHNANKFTEAGGTVLLELGVGGWKDGRWEDWKMTNPSILPSFQPLPSSVAVITVRDTGIGMEPQMLRRVFDAFSQADRSLDRSRGGLGLGLALVKSLIELHDGEVAIASKGLGQGTELTIRLPLEHSSSATCRSSKPPEAGGEGTVNSRRILVIEDNVDAAESMQVLLNLSGHQTNVAYDGTTGLEAARKLRPEVVLCDIGLPGGMNGFQIAQHLRQDPAMESMFLIAVTGYGREEDQRRAQEAGFNAHLTKPVDFTELHELLDSLSQPTT